MKIAIVGSRNIESIDVNRYLPKYCNEIISGGARGVDKLAEQLAKDNKIKLTVFLPEYRRYGRGAPIVRNKMIVDYADEVIAFWDGCSKGTEWIINYCKRIEKPCRIIIYERVCK